jgi:hypothetical protein
MQQGISFFCCKVRASQRTPSLQTCASAFIAIYLRFPRTFFALYETSALFSLFVTWFSLHPFNADGGDKLYGMLYGMFSSFTLCYSCATSILPSCSRICCLFSFNVHFHCSSVSVTQLFSLLPFLADADATSM